MHSARTPRPANPQPNRSLTAIAGITSICVALVLLAGCSSTNESAEKSAPKATAPTTTAKNPYGDPIKVDPPGPNDVVLTVTGPAAKKTYTLAAISGIGAKTLTIKEPFVKRTETFSAVPLESLLTPSGISGDQKVDTVALNEYVYSASAKSLVDGGALLAVSLDGNPIPIDQGGPIRIIFPDGSPGASNLDAWNWSLSSITAK